VPTEEETRWAQELLWTLWKRERNSSLPLMGFELWSRETKGSCPELMLPNEWVGHSSSL